MIAWLSKRIATPTLLAVALLASFAIVLGCAVASGHLLALAEHPDGSTSIDRSITSWVVAHRTHTLTTVARLLSTLGSQKVLTPLTAIATLVLVRRRLFLLAALLLAAWGGALGLYSLTKHFVQRMRPPSDIWLTHVGRTTSFPSGHATQSLATFTALMLVGAVLLPSARWPSRALVLALAIGVGWSRVYLGVHWATDVGAGWLIAGVWLAIVIWLYGVACSVGKQPPLRDPLRGDPKISRP